MTTPEQQHKAEKRIRAKADNVSERDTQKVVDKADRTEKNFNPSGFLRRILSDGRLLLSMFRDIITRRYRHFPWWTLAAGTIALLYVINPFDLVPDFIVGFGYIDNAVVVALYLRLVEKDLQ